ncbi:histidine phosphatase family protein [Pleurocapsales cyanobacterium LEGE 06147]|nr:histidine phosphatase family protein [Pleurocapsales cyanobacterium LEGE 06147]
MINNLSLSPPEEKKSSTTRVILVRHGRSNYNDWGKYQGCSDESILTEKGRKSAYQTGLALQKFTFDAIYTSPLKRVRQTTEEIIAALNTLSNKQLPSVFIDDKLIEINMSVWEGLFYEDVKKNFAEDYCRWREKPHLFSFQQNNKKQKDNTAYFPLLELYERAKQFWQEILAKHRGQTILIVAHGGTNRALISLVIGLKPAYYHYLQQSNCGISLLDFPDLENFNGQLQWLNLTTHLGETLPKLKEGKHGWRWLLLSAEEIQKSSQQLQVSFLFKKMFQQETINFILTDGDRNSDIFAQKWCENYTKTVHLSVDRKDTLEVWQQKILTKQKISNSQVELGLFNGLIIIQNNLLQNILGQILGSKTAFTTEATLGIIHYPHNIQRAIVQALLPLEKEIYYLASNQLV